jgi:hypothetical protein
MSTTLNSNTLNSTTALSLKATNDLNLYGNQILIYPTSSYGITFNNSSSTDYISNLNDLVIKSGGTINLNSNTTSGTINLQNINNNNPTTYGSFSNNQGSLTINSGSSNGGNINFGTYGYVNANNGFTVSSLSGNLNLSSPSNGTINLQYSGTTYGTFNYNTTIIGTETFNGFTLSSTSGNDLNLVSQASSVINLCCGNGSNKTTININTPNGYNQYGEYCAIQTTNNGNTLNINTPNSAGYIELNASSGVTTNYNSATLGSSSIINGNSLQNILGGLNSSSLGSLGGYNYITSRYVSNTTGYALINETPSGLVYGGKIYFNNSYNAVGGCYLVTTIYNNFMNNGEVGVSLVIGTSNIYSLVNLYSPGYISIGVAGTYLGDGFTPVSGSDTGLFFYSSSLTVNTVISFTTMQIA